MRVTEAMLKVYWDGNLPINFEKIFQKLKINVLYEDLSSSASSFILQNHQNTNTVIINNKEQETRQQYALAFALSYLITLPFNTEKKEFSSDCFISGSTINGIDFNKMTINFLIPKRYLEYVILKEKITCIDELCKIFNVSRNSMTYQLQQVCRL